MYLEILIIKGKWPEFEKVVYEELSNDKSVYKALATIISKKGSVPRGVGARC